jgi:hypothetical protein
MLKELRQRAHDRQRSELVSRIQAEKDAVGRELEARRALLAAASAAQSARDREARRLEQNGITAAEGQWRLAWERALRQNQEQLARDLDQAMRTRRAAGADQEQAQGALSRADAELKQVEGRLDQQTLALRRGVERTEQEAQDEAALRRFLERTGA